VADNFLSVINGKQINFINILNTERARQAEINKKILTSIVKTIPNIVWSTRTSIKRFNCI